MEKRIGRVLALTVLTTALLMSACGKSTAAESSGIIVAANEKRYNVQLTDAKPKKPVKIAVLAFQNNPYWLPVRDGAEYAAKKLKARGSSAEWIVVSENFDASRMVAAIETSIVKKYDGIALVAFEDSLVPAINKAVDAGLTVVTLDSDPDSKSKRMAFYGQDYFHSGELSAEYLATKIGGKGKVGIITGVFGATCPQQRMDGFKSWLKKNKPEISVVGAYENNDKAEIAYDLTKNFITANPDLKGIYVTAGGPFGASRAVQELKKESQVAVVGHDFIEDNFIAIKDGSMSAVIGEDPFQIGYDPVIGLYNYLVTGVKPQKEHMTTNMQTMTKNNIDALTANFK